MSQSHIKFAPEDPTKPTVQIIFWHYNDVRIGAMASQIISLTIVYSTFIQVQIKENIKALSLAFVWGIHRWPVNSPHKWPVTWKMFSFILLIITHFLQRVTPFPIHHTPCKFNCPKKVVRMPVRFLWSPAWILIILWSQLEGKQLNVFLSMLHFLCTVLIKRTPLWIWLDKPPGVSYQNKWINKNKINGTWIDNYICKTVGVIAVNTLQYRWFQNSQECDMNINYLWPQSAALIDSHLPWI